MLENNSLPSSIDKEIGFSEKTCFPFSRDFNKKYHEWIDGVDMPIAYTKKWGYGNIFHCSIGHNLKDFENINVVKLITQGIN